MKSTTFLRQIAASYRLPPTIKQLLTTPTCAADSSVHANVVNDPGLEKVTVNGWIKSIRRQKRVSFAVISDGSTSEGLQAVLGSSMIPKELTNGASVRFTGSLSKSPGSGQEKELLVDEVEVLGACDPETYPIQKQALSTEYLRDNVHLRARTGSIGAMLRLRDALQRNLQVYFEAQGFTNVNTPILTSNDAEGAGETFKLSKLEDTTLDQISLKDEQSRAEAEHFFSRPAHLTVSSQLHLEAVQSALGRVWTLSPCFRAERSQTNRHLAEFWMLEAEWGDVPAGGSSGVHGICTVVEGMLRETMRSVFENTKEDLAMLWSDNPGAKAALDHAVYGAPWARMTYTEAIALLQDAYENSGSSLFEFPPQWKKSLQSEHERWLAETYVKGPVFVTDYPKEMKPFYMRTNDLPVPGHGETVACFDLLVPGVGELVGGSVREEREDILVANMKEHNLGGSDGAGAYKWYVDLRRFGGAPHVGFGMGFERLVGWVGAIENVRECVPMPRWVGRLSL